MSQPIDLHLNKFGFFLHSHNCFQHLISDVKLYFGLALLEAKIYILKRQIQNVILYFGITFPKALKGARIKFKGAGSNCPK